jgi:hypothetical protein
MYASRSSVTSTGFIFALLYVPIVQENRNQRLQCRDVNGEAFDGAPLDQLVELRRCKRFIQPGPAAVPGLELGAGQAGFDLDHARAEEIEGGLVERGWSLEVESELQPAGPRVMPRFEVDLRATVVQLEQPAVSATCLAPSELLRKLRLDAFAETAEELNRRQGGGVYQPPEYIS